MAERILKEPLLFFAKHFEGVTVALPRSPLSSPSSPHFAFANRRSGSFLLGEPIFLVGARPPDDAGWLAAISDGDPQTHDDNGGEGRPKVFSLLRSPNFFPRETSWRGRAGREPITSNVKDSPVVVARWLSACAGALHRAIVIACSPTRAKD